MTDRLRLRAVLDSWFSVIVVALVLLVVLGAWGTYATHADPGTTTEEHVESTWELDGSFEHEATVTEPNPVYEVGTTLENRSVYPVRVAPEIDGTFAFIYRASEGGDLDADVELLVRHRAVDDETEEIVWETTDTVDRHTASSLESGSPLDAEFAVNLSALEAESSDIDEQLGEVPGTVETTVVAVVDLSGTVNGDTVDREQTYTLALDRTGNAYRLEDRTAGAERFESTEEIVVERSYSPVRSVGAPLLLGSSLIALIGLAVVRRRVPPLDDDERELLAYRADREELDEWIVTMTHPDGVDGGPRIEAASLADLVDFAIDTDNGVVYDTTRDEYLVAHRDRTYVYAPPTAVGAKDDDAEAVERFDESEKPLAADRSDSDRQESPAAEIAPD